MKLRVEFFIQALPFTHHFSPVFPSQFHSVPLYLEWAPMGVFLSPTPQKREAVVPGKEGEAGLVPGKNLAHLLGSLCFPGVVSSPRMCFVWVTSHCEG